MFYPVMGWEILIFPTAIRPPWSSGKKGITRSLCLGALPLTGFYSCFRGYDLALSYNAPRSSELIRPLSPAP